MKEYKIRFEKYMDVLGGYYHNRCLLTIPREYVDLLGVTEKDRTVTMDYIETMDAVVIKKK